MIIVIDAYNVLKQALSTTHIADQAKQRFVKQLSIYAKKKGHTIIVVFDGGPYEWADKERVQGILLVHSGMHESADDWIKKYVAQHKTYDILVVSTDRELGMHVHRAGVQTLDAMDFHSLLQECLQQPHAQTKEQELVKIAEHENPELDQLMQEAASTVPTKAEDVGKVRERKARQISKQERKIAQKIKKL